MSLIELNKLKLEQEVLNRDGVSLVDFYAPWCGPCQTLSPIVEEIVRQHPEIRVGKVNTDGHPRLTASFGVTSLPTLIVFQDGKEHCRIIGYRSKEAILETLL